ncbi:MAG: hypothetical protein QNL90_01535 [Gammaproteobacteria bacterium]|jgi:hypothetical protein|nr:hypothetical protein [Gammaproteobacteria bacterium]MDX2458753.1 hypothetical protein [Gammaproteobacteria bacterium]
MREIDLFDDESGATVFRDVIMLALAGFVMIVMLLLPHVNPRAANEHETQSPGNVMVELRWPDHIDADVDLWVEGPGDSPVGYSNKDGSVFNLLRDDLGRDSDLTDLNYEFSYSRGVPSGEYTVNVHLYRNGGHHFPLPVTIAVSVKGTNDSSSQRLLNTKLDLLREGQETTVFRFQLDEDGDLIAGSVHDLPRALRSRTKL